MFPVQISPKKGLSCFVPVGRKEIDNSSPFILCLLRNKSSNQIGRPSLPLKAILHTPLERMTDINDPSCINTGDTTWVTVSSIFVLSMMPALAFFEGMFLFESSPILLFPFSVKAF